MSSFSETFHKGKKQRSFVLCDEAVGGGVMGGFMGGITGGLFGGINALSSDRNFWNGRYSSAALKRMGITFTGDPVDESDLNSYFNDKFKNRIDPMEHKPTSLSVNDARVGRNTVPT